MGSCDSNCCSGKLGPLNTNTLKSQRKKQSYTRLQTQNFINQQFIGTNQCVSPNDITKCESLSRIQQVLHKYQSWLDHSSLMHSKQILDYSQYYDDIINWQIYSLDLLLSDIKHVKYVHEYRQISRYFNENLKSCSRNNCFSMKHCFSQNNNVTTHNQYHKIIDPLQPLTQLHCYIFHTSNISQYDMQYTAPINCYIVATYCESIHRQSTKYEQKIPNNIVHLCTLYFDGKREEEQVESLQLANFIEGTMNRATFNRVWRRVHRDECDIIDSDEIEDILLLCAILRVAYEHKLKNSRSHCMPKISKSSVKEAILPIADWVKNEKMRHGVFITKEKFRETMTLWLREYTHSETTHGVIVDNKQQCLVLKKYDIDKSVISEYINDCLVFNCDNMHELIEKDSLVNWMLLNCSKCAKVIVSGYISGCKFSVPKDIINVLWKFLIS